MENGSLGVADPNSSVPSVEFKNLHRYFDDTCAVDNLSFQIFPGEVFGFIGPNGAGKTTSMRILSTLDQPSSGDAFVDGLSVTDDPDRVRRRLGYMPDGFGTYPNVTCEEYLDFFARSYGFKGARRRKCLREVMHFTQLDEIAQKPIDGLSKGMKQRLCLSRTLIHNPSVLILDEPAAGLDPRARIELRDIILELSKQGKTLLISSHILSELAEVCSRVGIIERGELLAVGTVDEILNSASSLPASSADKNGRRVQAEVTVASGLDDCQKFLVDVMNVEHVEADGNAILFPISSDADDQADLLKQLIDGGIRVSSFKVKQKSLEEAFLHVTQGRIQ